MSRTNASGETSGEEAPVEEEAKGAGAGEAGEEAAGFPATASGTASPDRGEGEGPAPAGAESRRIARLTSSRTERAAATTLVRPNASTRAKCSTR